MKELVKTKLEPASVLAKSLRDLSFKFEAEIFGSRKKSESHS